MVRFVFPVPTRKLNNKGCRVNETTTTEIIPIIARLAMERKAGCFARIRTPSPVRVVSIEISIDDLNDRISS
ncbi:hypothetical protein ES703_113831 [subsurface metagenome]